MLDAHDEPSGDEHDDDRDDEYHRVRLGRGLGDAHHGLDDDDDQRGHRGADDGGQRVREVEDAKVLAGLVRVRQDGDVQSLVDRVVGAVAEARDRGEQVHAHLGAEQQRHQGAEGEQAAGECDRQLPHAEPVGQRTGRDGGDQGDDERDDGHRGDDGRGLDLGVRVAGEDVVLGDEQLVGVDHPVAAHHHRAAGERVVEVGGVLRRAEAQQDGLRGDLLARLVHVGLLAGPDDDDDDAAQAEDDQTQHPAGEDAGGAVLEQLGADEGADGLAGGDAGAIEAGDGAAELVGNAVGHRGDVRGEHDVVSELGAAPQQQDQGVGVDERDGADGQACDDAADDDPRAALAEAGSREVGEGAEDDVGEQRDDRADAVDEAEHRLLGGRVDAFEHGRQDDGAQRHPWDGAGDGGDGEADAEADHLGLGRAVAVGGDGRIVDRGVRGQSGGVGRGGGCISHVVIPF